VAFQYAFYNGPFPTTAAFTPVTSSTSLKTMLQVKMSSPHAGKIVEWGFSGDASAAATPGVVSLIETGTVFGTVTASVAGDIVKYNDPNAPTSTTYFDVGTAATGYTATAEGTVTASRLFECQQMPPTGFYSKQFPLGREPMLTTAGCLRIRVKFGTAVNLICYVIIEV